jgi:hypothetical protein
MQTLRTSALALSLTTAFAQLSPVSQVYQFDNAFSGVGYVNIENVAVRSSNNDLLINTVTGAIMAELNPESPPAQLVVNISSAYPGAPGSLTGIAEIGTDEYAVAAGDFVFGPQVPGGINGVAGSFSIWKVDLEEHYKAVASLVVAIPEAGLLNAVAKVPCEEDVVLVADSALGGIWRVDVAAGKYEQVFADPLLLPGNGVSFGINGIKFGGYDLYFTNSAQGFFGVIPFNKHGYPTGAIKKLAYAPEGSSFDDFAIGASGYAYLVAQPSLIVKAPLAGGDAVLVANDTLISNPTSCVFRGDLLYVVTGGAGGGPMGPVSGNVASVNVGDYAAGTAKCYRWVK